MQELRQTATKNLGRFRAWLRLKIALRGTAVAFVVFTISLIITTVVWRYNTEVTKYQAQIKFDLLTKDIEFVTQNRINRNIDVLSGVKGLFAASSQVTRKEFDVYTENLFKNQYPALLGVSYIKKVVALEKEAFLASVRNDSSLDSAGYPSFDIKPAGNRDTYYVVDYINPFDSTLVSFGYDVRTDNLRAAAIERARDTGLVSISPRVVTLSQKTNAFIVYIPLYKKGTSLETVTERRAAFIGVISGGFDVDRFFAQVFPEQQLYDGVNFEIYDSEQIVPEHLLYDSDPNVKSAVAGSTDELRKVMRISVDGNNWIIYANASREGILGYTSSRFPSIVALGGLVASLSLFGIVLSFATARRRALEIAESITAKFKENEEKYRSIFEALQDVYYRTDINGIITMISPSIQKHIGLAPAEVIGHNSSEFYTDPNAREKMLAELMKNGTLNDHLLELKGPNKPVINASLNARLLRDETGTPIGIEGMLRDVTERARTETNLEERTAELQATKERIEKETHKLNAILSSMGESLIATDEQGRVVVMNQAASVMLRIAEGDARGKKIEMILPLFKEKTPIDEADSPIYKALRDKGITRTFLHDNIFSRDKDGQMFPVVLSATSLLGRGGVEGIAGIIMFRDVTAEKTIDTSKTEFVSLASHQLRTPLTAINWYTEMLLSGDVGKVNAEQRKYLEEIYHGNQRMVDLVSALLNVSRIDLGTFAVEPETISLKEVAESVLKELEPSIEKKHQKTTQKYPRGLAKFVADPKLMRIIFQNLLSNAVKYTPEHGEIGIKIENKDDKVRIIVSDTGYGIPLEDQTKIFTKLYRADNIREKDADGTGLGLYIVKSIVEQSGGSITFVSEENKGTTFHVTFPKTGMKAKQGVKGLS